MAWLLEQATELWRSIVLALAFDATILLEPDMVFRLLLQVLLMILG